METLGLAVLALALGAGVSGALASTWGLRRKLLGLEYRIADAEDRLLTLSNRAKVQNRWTTKADREADLLTALKTAGPKQRFANEPLEPEL